MKPEKVCTRSKFVVRDDVLWRDWFSHVFLPKRVILFGYLVFV